MKVMIVDDEVIIRNGLSTVINWEENGFTVLEPAASAEEALQRIPDEQPEIIFTDIRMTGLSGIDMAREVKKRFPDTEIIIISGFDEFAYAQQAMREGVSDYLLKTSRPGEIIQSAAKARERLELRRRNEEGGKAQQTIVNRGFLRRLLASGSAPDAEAEAEFWDRFPDLRPDSGGFNMLRIWLLSVHSPGSGERGSHPGGDVNRIVGSRVAERLACAWLEWNGDLLILVKSPGGEDWGRMRPALVHAEAELGCRVTAAGGLPFTRLQELPRALATASEAGSYAWLLRAERRIRYEEVAARRGIRTVCAVEEETELFALLRAGDDSRLQFWITDLLERIELDREATPGSVQAYLHSILVSARRWLERAAASIGYSSTLPSGAPFDMHELARRPGRIMVHELKRIKQQYEGMVSSASPVERAVAYIHDHLGQSLSLQQVAKHVHMNTNYFSELFKRETGRNYIEYVTQAKLRKAMMLLRETPAKVSEVAGEIGYEDLKYFNRLFKKFTGQTPSEYRASPEVCPSPD
ncbi:response regulator [Paenibacillus sp. XY044]|uniref:response regulator transcription factor n=1 Tax=Paenibacillus sp. XY044 TaxID=2026089 RepID=UPI000B98BB2D|nr:response regulator [Paenibacillus sp. XY044]OZB91110.1 DNA-binding response regulator [Paenibacillus sp. XY044]